MRKFLFLIMVAAAAAATLNAQTWNSNAGGYNTGYGTVYGSFGLAMATQNIYNTMQMQMQRTMARNAMIKKWGLAAVEKAEREAKSGSGSRSTSTAAPKVDVPPPPVVRNYGLFRPDATVDTAKAVADAMGETPEEKALVRKIYAGTKSAYEKEAAAKGWGNNIAGSLTFFTITAMTVYNDADEPSDDAVAAYYAVVNRTLDEMPEFAKVTNKEKQAFHNTMIAFGGLLLAGYIEGKQGNSPETVKMYSQLAGMLIKMVLKMEPDQLKIKNGMIVVE
ncbi:MAG: hypothetical protein KA746_16835 [Pyrinomonadaceae bacterium]|nr:hypothetical protein [Pyrinomonadaceae bacterium]MBP6212405.1 hypothetical protein [Pyrinomonadaceae bacterium]